MRVMLHRFENVDKAQIIVCKSRDLMNKLYIQLSSSFFSFTLLV